MDTIDKPTALILVDLLWQYGVADVVVSPGSRCAPIVVALHRSGHYRLTTVIDERSAAFVALGMARATERPVALVCTSGSAVLNYGAALAEAYYSNVPLIAISADRPADIIDQRDGQTIRQPGALSAVVHSAVDIAEAHTPKEISFANRLINNALATACCRMPHGPVHINMQFEAPLTPSCPMPTAPLGRKIDLINASRPDLQAHMATIDSHARVMVVAGALPYSPALIDCVAASTVFVTVAEVQANLNTRGVLRPESIISCNAINKGSFSVNIGMPEIVITIGGSLVSAPFKAWLRGIKDINPAVRHISVGYEADAPFVDTYGMLSEAVECEPLDYLQALSGHLQNNSYKAEYQKLCADIPVKDCDGISLLINALAKTLGTADLHLSNGMSVRYGQALWPKGRVFANRGVSGIEGSTSTAIGSAIATAASSDTAGRPTLLITGDMSAAYDVGALAIAGIPDTLRMVVLDNGGGDIFRHVATTRSLPERELYFATPPQLPLQELARAYGFSYYELSAETATSATSELSATVAAFMAAPRPAILNYKLND